VCYFESHFDRYRPEVRNRWREQGGPGSGIWYDLGPHLLDQAVNLFGLPVSITVDLAQLRPGAQATDYFHAVLAYPQRRVVLHGTLLAAQKPRDISSMVPGQAMSNMGWIRRRSG
jgi:predicted dehydrogenase